MTRRFDGAEATSRSVLFVCALTALVVGLGLALAPAAFHASLGIESTLDATEASETRGPGGALMALGVVMGLGVARRSERARGLVVAAATYLGYAGARLLGLALDGIPSSGILAALGAEFGLAVAAVVALHRETRVPGR